MRGLGASRWLCLLTLFACTLHCNHAYYLPSHSQENKATAATAKATTAVAVAAQASKKTVARGNPITYNPNWPWKRAGQGRCSKDTYTIPVSKVSDISRRKRHSPKKTVILRLDKSLVLSQGLIFDNRFACTIFTASASGLFVAVTDNKSPALAVVNASNVLVTNVSFLVDLRRTSSCGNIDPEGSDRFACPAVLVYRSYGVQITKGKVTGRVQVVRSMAVSIDSMDITSDLSFEISPGAVRVLASGSGPNLVRSGISISNNRVHDSFDAIVLHEGAVGVDVYNNYIFDYGFAGIRCGDYISYQGDCMLTKVFRNLVYSKRSNVTGDGDAAGIYYNTHFFNPGNLATCNYVYGGDRCYYLDNHSSGVVILGGGCINNQGGGVKINGGKRNVVKWLVMKNVNRFPAWAQCLFVKEFNCLSEAGKKWEYMRKIYYNNATINKFWPWFSKVCSETKVNGGKSCNPSGTPSASVTGKCSGLATDNYADVVLANTTDAPGTRYCEDYPQVESLNQFVYINKTYPKNYQFVNYVSNNLALKPSSPLYTVRPYFRSCDSRLVGPRRVKQAFYFRRFNIPKPYGFNGILNLNTRQIHDRP